MLASPPLPGGEANTPARHQFHVTPLHEAAHIGSIELCRLLLGHGADAAAADDNGRTAVDVARERGYTAVVELLGQRS